MTHWHSPELHDSVEDLMLSHISYVTLELLSCVCSWSRIEAMHSAFWSAESEALRSAEHCGPLKTRLYHSAKQDLMLSHISYVTLELLSCVCSWSRIEAMHSAFWSAESEALRSAEHCGPLKTRLYHSAKHCGPLKARLKTMAKSQIFLPFFYI